MNNGITILFFQNYKVTNKDMKYSLQGIEDEDEQGKEGERVVVSWWWRVAAIDKR